MKISDEDLEKIERLADSDNMIYFEGKDLYYIVTGLIELHSSVANLQQAIQVTINSSNSAEELVMQSKLHTQKAAASIEAFVINMMPSLKK